MPKNLLLLTMVVGCLAAAPGTAEAVEETQAPSASLDEERPRPPRHHRGPRLTDEQRACLENTIGKPGEGERPSREKMHAAMKSCGVKVPPRRGGGGPPPPREEEEKASQE